MRLAEGKSPSMDQFGATLTLADLATHQAVVQEVHANGMRLVVKRGRDGKLSLLSLLRFRNAAPVRAECSASRRGAKAHPRGDRVPRRV